MFWKTIFNLLSTRLCNDQQTWIGAKVIYQSNTCSSNIMPTLVALIYIFFILKRQYLTQSQLDFVMTNKLELAPEHWTRATVN